MAFTFEIEFLLKVRLGTFDKNTELNNLLK